MCLTQYPEIAPVPAACHNARGMFSKVTSSSVRTCACPDCGAGLAGKPDRRAQVLTCPECGVKASVAEWTRWPGGRSPLIGRADSPPPDTRIHRENGQAGVTWRIPATGNFGFPGFFGTLWTLVTAFVSGGFLFAFLSGQEIRGNGPDWVLIPLFGVFWAIGLTFLYFGARRKWLNQRLVVAAGELISHREMFGRTREKRMPIAGIRLIGQKEFYQQNHQSVFGIEIRGDSGKFRFGSALAPEEKTWLVADLRNAVFGPKPVAAAPQPQPALSQNSNFSVEIPSSRRYMWTAAVVTGLVGAGFLAAAATFLNDRPPRSENDAPLPARIFDMIFIVAGTGFQLVFALAGAALVIGSAILFFKILRARGCVRKLEGNSDEIAIRTYRHNLPWKVRTFPRSTITGIRAPDSGSSGGTMMKRLELIAGDQAIKLADWTDSIAADEFVAAVRPAL